MIMVTWFVSDSVVERVIWKLQMMDFLMVMEAVLSARFLTMWFVVKVGDQIYFCVTDYVCSAEANGRPVYTLTENYHLTYASCIPLMTAESGLKFAIKSASYRYEERGNGALF